MCLASTRFWSRCPAPISTTFHDDVLPRTRLRSACAHQCQAAAFSQPATHGVVHLTACPAFP